MMNRINFLLSLVIAVLICTPASAGDPERGQKKSSSCVVCHGADGNSPTPAFPKLAGQYEDYMLHALREYKSGARKNPVMAGIVAGLSEEDMRDLSAYYASQNGLKIIQY